jgi:hypothetical protein
MGQREIKRKWSEVGDEGGVGKEGQKKTRHDRQ